MRHQIEIPDSAQPGRYGVYVAFSADGDVLYIGRTQNLLSRLQHHRTQSTWHSGMRSLEWTPCRDVVEARKVEKGLIATFRPESNVNDRRPQASGRHALPEWCGDKLRSLYAASFTDGWCATSGDALLNGYIRELHRKGWSHASIAVPLGMTREAVRLRELRPAASAAHLSTPSVPVVAKPVRPPKPSVSAAQRIRLRELHALARQVNGSTAADDPRRDASIELSELIAEIHLTDGVLLGRIAEALGVTYLAVKARLARHGYISGPPSMAHAAYKGQPTDFVGSRRTECHRGHRLEGDNVRFVNGDASTRVCRTCERIRVARYQQKIRGAA